MEKSTFIEVRAAEEMLDGLTASSAKNLLLTSTASGS